MSVVWLMLCFEEAGLFALMIWGFKKGVSEWLSEVSKEGEAMGWKWRSGDEEEGMVLSSSCMIS